MTERPPLSRALRESTRLLHTDAERAGAMGALLRGRIDRSTYVLMLSSLHAIYLALEDALQRNAEHESIAPLLVPGLERRDALAADLRALTLADSSTAFYAFPALDDPMRVAGAWRTALDALALDEDAQDAIETEAADGFRRHIALFEGLADQDDAAA